jgi:hypothetical protein
VVKPSLETGIGLGLLVAGFFWRGRRKPQSIIDQTSAPAAVAADSAPVEFPRLIPPVMLVNLGPAAAPADLESAPPLGERRDVRERVSAAIGRADPAGNGRAIVRGPDWSLALNFGEEDPVWTIAIEARGDGSADALERLAQETGWRIFVPRLGRFADPAALRELTAS